MVWKAPSRSSEAKLCLAIPLFNIHPFDFVLDNVTSSSIPLRSLHMILLYHSSGNVIIQLHINFLTNLQKFKDRNYFICLRINVA